MLRGVIDIIESGKPTIGNTSVKKLLIKILEYISFIVILSLTQLCQSAASYFNFLKSFLNVLRILGKLLSCLGSYLNYSEVSQTFKTVP